MTHRPAAAAIRRLFVSDPGRYLTSSLVVFAMTGLVNVLVAQVLGPTGKGDVTLLLTAAMLAGAAATLGLELSLCRGLAADPRRTLPGAPLIAAVTLLGLATGAAGALAAAAISDSVGGFGAVGLTALVTAATTATLVTANLLVAIRASARLLIARAVGAVLMLASTAVVLAAGGGTLAVVACTAAGGALTLGLQLAGVRRRAPRALGRSTSRARGLLGSGLKTHVGTVVQTAAYRIDFFIVAALLSSSALGIYSIAVMLATMLWFLPDALGATLLQRAATSEARAALRRALAQTTMATVAGAAVLAAASPWLIPAVFGDGFGDAYVPMLILLPGVLVLGWWKIAVNYLFARGHDTAKTRGAAVAAVTGVALDFALIPGMGLSGAAVAASVGYAGAAAVAAHDLNRREGIPLSSLVRPSRSHAPAVPA